jgi:hypothetical protein
MYKSRVVPSENPALLWFPWLIDSFILLTKKTLNKISHNAHVIGHPVGRPWVNLSSVSEGTDPKIAAQPWRK